MQSMYCNRFNICRWTTFLLLLLHIRFKFIVPYYLLCRISPALYRTSIHDASSECYVEMYSPPRYHTSQDKEFEFHIIIRLDCHFMACIHRWNLLFGLSIWSDHIVLRIMYDLFHIDEQYDIALVRRITVCIDFNHLSHQIKQLFFANIRMYLMSCRTEINQSKHTFCGTNIICDARLCFDKNNN